MNFDNFAKTYSSVLYEYEYECTSVWVSMSISMSVLYKYNKQRGITCIQYILIYYKKCEDNLHNNYPFYRYNLAQF